MFRIYVMKEELKFYRHITRPARDGNKTTIPSNYLPEDYKAPEFNIKLNKEQHDD